MDQNKKDCEKIPLFEEMYDQVMKEVEERTQKTLDNFGEKLQ